MAPSSNDGRTADASPYPATLVGEEGGGLAAAKTPRRTDSVQCLMPASERYVSGEVLGAGGMGEVAVATDQWVGRDVARKRMLVQAGKDPQTVRRFLREVRIQGQLEHPAIVPVYDLSQDDDGTVEFTMRRIRGVTLSDVLYGNTSPATDGTNRLSHLRHARTRLLTAFVSVCMAIHYAHSRGVVHRDLKPGNIMLGEFGEVYVLDWGIAKVLQGIPRGVTVDAIVGQSPSEELTGAGQMMGTPGYMAPEQLEGESAAIGPAADIYALGSILYEILALRPVHANARLVEIAVRMLHGFERSPSKVRADVPAELDEICCRALERQPADRFPTALALAEAIERYIEGDREESRRKELAVRYALTAREHAARSMTPSVRAERAHVERTAAMHNAIRALALDPVQVDAQKTMVDLLSSVPRKLPPSGEAEMTGLNQQVRREGGRMAFLGYLSWLAAVPFVFIAGVSDVILATVMICLVMAVALFGLRLSRPGSSTSTLHVVPIVLISNVCVAMCSKWLGPFVLVPTMSVTNSMFLTVYATRVERRYLIAVGAFAVALPFMLEAFGIVKPSFEFRDGGIFLFKHVINLRPTITTLSLLYTSVSFAILPVIYLGMVRDRLRDAERRLFVQAWHFKHLFTTAEGTATV